ncbi:isocitrate lyase/phosphoenolpyruvate mutase family protein [Rhodopseudomonas palustris]|uniref:isocitrate lyase/PEP mutase family protein n=1 Tax=Rhodopseudomonas palustris TaxID=1076 RepID=UPI002ACD727C|nr:isocitrate lyase/phosphoenolpyruvate mutase family protein [Rhodopseudomonas palustris]WQH01781.1 isocitrate lyase/phosphoenolpyruvate mutase family protein [Rhodopseudomonas palustris]
MPVPTAAKRAAFRKLHDSGCFVLPNPWDVGSARLLQQLGFQALASTSSGYAWSTGRADNRVTCDDVLAHLTTLSAAVDLPVNADFEGGFADAPEGVAANVTRAVATGIAGLSIENSTGDAARPLYDDALGVDRIKAARAAIDATGEDVLLVARCEGFLCGERDLGKTAARLVAFAEAGADCLYAPGVSTEAEITTLVQAIAPKPLNVLIVQPTMTVAALADLGVRRISVGGALARTAWAGFLNAAREIAEEGTFTAFAGAAKGAELNGVFGGR